jgi:hypothetical protein
VSQIVYGTKRFGLMVPSGKSVAKTEPRTMPPPRWLGVLNPMGSPSIAGRRGLPVTPYRQPVHLREIDYLTGNGIAADSCCIGCTAIRPGVLIADLDAGPGHAGDHQQSGSGVAHAANAGIGANDARVRPAFRLFRHLKTMSNAIANRTLQRT